MTSTATEAEHDASRVNASVGIDLTAAQLGMATVGDAWEVVNVVFATPDDWTASAHVALYIRGTREEAAEGFRAIADQLDPPPAPVVPLATGAAVGGVNLTPRQAQAAARWVQALLESYVWCETCHKLLPAETWLFHTATKHAYNACSFPATFYRGGMNDE